MNLQNIPTVLWIEAAAGLALVCISFLVARKSKGGYPPMPSAPGMFVLSVLIIPIFLFSQHLSDEGIVWDIICTLIFWIFLFDLVMLQHILEKSGTVKFYPYHPKCVSKWPRKESNTVSEDQDHDTTKRQRRDDSSVYMSEADVQHGGSLLELHHFLQGAKGTQYGENISQSHIFDDQNLEGTVYEFDGTLISHTDYNSTDHFAESAISTSSDFGTDIDKI